MKSHPSEGVSASLPPVSDYVEGRSSRSSGCANLDNVVRGIFPAMEVAESGSIEVILRCLEEYISPMGRLVYRVQLLTTWLFARDCRF